MNEGDPLSSLDIYPLNLPAIHTSDVLNIIVDFF